eukprot:7107184-Alexandrium_andersonii.AAC.1
MKAPAQTPRATAVKREGTGQRRPAQSAQGAGGDLSEGGGGGETTADAAAEAGAGGPPSSGRTEGEK